MLLWVFSSQSWWEWCILLFSVQNGSCQWTPPTLISWITSITLDQIKRSITSSFIHGHAAETWHQKQGPHPLYDCLSYSSVGAGESHSEKCSLLNNESNFLLRSCMHNVYLQLLEIWWHLSGSCTHVIFALSSAAMIILSFTEPCALFYSTT